MSNPKIGNLYRQVRDRFRAAALPTADLDAKLLVGFALGLSPSDLVLQADENTGSDKVTRAMDYMVRRLAGCPVGRILGEREFYGRAFALNAETLEPRPDTETLVDAVLERIDPISGCVFADIGTGTGAIAVTLLCEIPDAIAVATDLSMLALRCARSNAERHDVCDRFLAVQADLASPLASGFDWVVSNPPYIPTEEIGRLSREVQEFDPFLALDGGSDGLDAYRMIAVQAEKALKSGGGLAVEHGFDQAADVAEVVKSQGFVAIEQLRDLAGQPRVLVARRK